jgi:hypothetical protein
MKFRTLLAPAFALALLVPPAEARPGVTSEMKNSVNGDHVMFYALACTDYKKCTSMVVANINCKTMTNYDWKDDKVIPSKIARNSEFGQLCVKAYPEYF